MRSRSRWNSVRPTRRRFAQCAPARMRRVSGVGRERQPSGVRIAVAQRVSCSADVSRSVRRHGAAGRARSASQQDEADLAAFGFLVDAASVRCSASSAERRRRDRQLRALRAASTMRCDVRLRQHAQSRCDRSRRHHHAAADRFAVQPFAVARVRPRSRGRTCGRNSASRARPPSRSSLPTTSALISHERWIACASAAASRATSASMFASIQSKKSAVGDRAVLDDFGQARAEFARGQRAQRGSVGDHRVRLVERADHVLAERMIDRRSCRQPRNPPARAASSAPGRTARRACSAAAAKPVMSPITPPPSAISAVLRSQRCASNASKTELSVCQFLCCSPSGITIGVTVTPAAVERAGHHVQIQGRHRGVGDQRGAFLRQMARDHVAALEQMLADINWIAAIGQGDFDGLHRLVGRTKGVIQRARPCEEVSGAGAGGRSRRRCSSRLARLPRLWLPVP